MKITAHRVLLPEGFVFDRTVLVEKGMIREIARAEEGDISCDTLVPGLIDQHLHGGFGADVMHSGADKLLDWLRFLQRNGCTQVLDGVYTYPVPVMRKALETAKTVIRLQAQGAGGAILTGVHLEGPFISRRSPGAMLLDSILAPTIENWQRVTEGYEDIIRMVTLAPEEPGADELIRYLTARGIAVSAGHTAATVEDGKQAFRNGVNCITHFFNASTPIHHRAPGILTEALLDDRVYCECICDFVHVHPEAVRLIHRCKGAGRMIVISDAVFTTGLKDGVYPSGDEITVVKDGVSRTPEGALAGGGSVQLQEVRNLISVGIPEEDAFRMASQTPAEYLRITGGRIIPWARAELLCLDQALKPICTVIGDNIVKGEN